MQYTQSYMYINQKYLYDTWRNIMIWIYQYDVINCVSRFCWITWVPSMGLIYG